MIARPFCFISFLFDGAKFHGASSLAYQKGLFVVIGIKIGINGKPPD